MFSRNTRPPSKRDPAAYGTSTIVFLFIYGGLRLLCWWGKGKWPEQWPKILEDALVMYFALAGARRFYQWSAEPDTPGSAGRQTQNSHRA